MSFGNERVDVMMKSTYVCSYLFFYFNINIRVIE